MISAYNLKTQQRESRAKIAYQTAPQSIIPSPRSDESLPVSQKSARRRNIQLDKKSQARQSLPIGHIFKKSEDTDGVMYKRQHN